MTTGAQLAATAVMDLPLRVRPLTIVAHDLDFLVGDGSLHVVIPEAGIRVLELLRTGRTGRQAIGDLQASGTDVDVADFLEQLVELGWVEKLQPSEVIARDSSPSVERADPTRFRFLFSGPAWVAYVACLAGSLALLVYQPRLIPHTADIFFLSTPARSLAALTAITFMLGAAHEASHMMAARAEGLRSRVAISRRLYFFTLETDLSALWGLPRRRRYSALLAGMASDTVILFLLLMMREAGLLGWWHPALQIVTLLSALTLLQLTGLVAQFFLFLRTDLYAVLVTVTGCVNLWEVTHLLLRQRLHRLTPAQEQALAQARPRDLTVARYYVWFYAAGLMVATWFFFAMFLPVTLHTASWLVRSVTAASVRSGAFWEALVLGALILTPELLTARVALRDLWRRKAGLDDSLRSARP